MFHSRCLAIVNVGRSVQFSFEATSVFGCRIAQSYSFRVKEIVRFFLDLVGLTNPFRRVVKVRQFVTDHGFVAASVAINLSNRSEICNVSLVLGV